MNMKKLFTLMMVAMTALVARATDYTVPIIVTVNGEVHSQEGTITITQEDGLYSLSLNNFILMNGEDPMGVGNIALTGIEPMTIGSTVLLDVNREVLITEGDDPSIPLWMGPFLPPIPIELRAVLEGDCLNAVIDIDMSLLLQQIIRVTIGTGMQFVNPGFEEWHTSAEGYEEPNGWHSFESASGNPGFVALSGHHIEKSDKGRNESSCARIYATDMWLAIANGTMTTGRLNAGSMTAADTQNNAYIDMSKTDVDGNGDPFYMPLNTRPDSLVVWLQFHQGKAVADHPYATVSAAITDGTYYQDPQDKEYSNIVATAANRTITVTGDEWQRFSMPFEYKDNSLNPKALLVTISTNADAGKGSDKDEVLVDDIELVYNGQLQSLNVPGFKPDVLNYEVQQAMSLDEIVAEPQGRGAYVVKSLGESGDGKVQAEIKVISADLSAVTVYTIKFMNSSVGITSVENTTAAPQYYTLGGQQLHSPRAGQVLIVRQADGRYLKVKK